MCKFLHRARRLAGLLLTLLIAAPAAPLAQISVTAEALVDQAVNGFLETTTSTAPPAALSVSVCRDGEVVLAKGYGQLAPGKPVRPDTLYHAGSLTKQFTAATVLDYINRGARIGAAEMPLMLETEATAIFDGVEHWSRDKEHPVTVRRLLNMNSNLPNFTRRPPNGADPWGAIPAQTLLTEVKKLGQSGWPDSFEYSNTSYFLLAGLLEASRLPGEAQPQSYIGAVRSSVIERAGLTSTYFAGEAVPTEDLAPPLPRRRPAFMQPDWLKGSGDLISNVLDMARWNTALMEGRVLPDWARTAMFDDGARIGPTEWYGMGWFIEHEPERDVFSHTGSIPGYTSLNTIIRPHGKGSWLSVTVLTNIDDVPDIETLGERIADAFLLK